MVLGNTLLTNSGITAMLSYSDYPIATLYSTNSGILVIDCDLGYRLDTYQINYNFRSSSPIYSTASGINFYYRDESFGDYLLLPTYYDGTEHYYTTKSGEIFAPRYIRIVTTMTSISGTTITGTVHGFEILNNDVIVDFGIDGSKIEEDFYLTKDGASEIRSIPIYNNGVYEADAIINVEPSFNNLDQVISVSDSENGPWVYPVDENLTITNSDIFSEGVFSNTESVDGSIQISGILDKNNTYVCKYFSSSYYVTKVFEKTDAEYMMLLIEKNTSSLGGKISVDSDDVVDTIQIRYSDYKPATYSIYRTLYTFYPGTGATSYAAFKDYWRSTGLLKQTSTYYFFSFSSYRTVMDYYIVIDPVTERWAGFLYTAAGSGGVINEWRVFNNVKESSSVNLLMSSQTTTNTGLLFKWGSVILDSTGGMWVYFWATSYHSSEFVDFTGYYLAYFTSSLSNSFKLYNGSTFVYDMSADYVEGYLWYTDNESGTITKISRDGTIVINYSEDGFTDVLGGITALSDGSAWYFNNGSLHRIRKSLSGGIGSIIFIDSIENISSLNFSKLAKDGDGSEALWVIEDVYVGRIFVSGDKKGQFDFKIMLDTPTRLFPVEEGCWVWSASTTTTGNTRMIFVSKLNKRIENNLSLSYSSSPGTMEYTYTNKNYAAKMPLSIDDNWKNLSWNKINTNTYVLSESKYQQLKLTFRNQTPVERYPDFGFNDTTPYLSSDSFTQDDGPPINRQLWSDWTKTYNVVNVQNGRLVLPNSSEPLAGNTYIITNNRLLVGGNFDIRIKFMFGLGTPTGILEQLWLRVYAYDTVYFGATMTARLYVPPYNSNATLNIDTLSSTGVSNNGVVVHTYNTNIGWQGVLRLVKGSDGYIYAQYDKAYDGTFEVYTGLPGASNYGTYFYVQIFGYKGGSTTYIDDFQIVSGDVYYYTETPGLKSIHTLKPVIINDIFPATSKNLYIRNQVPTGLDVLNNYDTNLNVRWRVPTS